jgi:intraflagellar transport protein 52
MDAQFDVLRQYMDGGGAIVMQLSEGGETQLDTNVNFLLEEYGIMVNHGS